MQTIDWSIPRRQSWAAVLFVALRLIKVGYKAFGILALSILLKGKFSLILFAGLIAIIILILFIAALLQFWFFTISIKEGIIQVHQGIFFKKRIHLPAIQIQSLHTDQTLWHRITQTCRIKIDSPGSEKTEVTLDAISESDAAWLQQQLSTHQDKKSENTEPHVSQKPLIQRSLIDMVKWSLTINHFQTIALIFVFGLTLLNDLEQAFKWNSYDKLDEGVEGFNPGILLLIIGIFLFLMIIVIASIVMTIYRWFGFTVISDENGFKIKAGLIHVQQWNIPFRKIQVWEFRSNWIRRMFNQIRLEWRTIGEQKEKGKQKPWAPLFGTGEMNDFIDKAGFSFPSNWSDAKGIHRRYLTRFYIVAILSLCTGVLIAFFTSPLWSMVISGLTSIFLVAHGRVFQHRFRYLISSDGLWIRKGIWGTQHVFLPWKNIQFQTLSQSIFQQQSSLSTLYLRTAAGSYSLPFIPIDVANQICTSVSLHLQTVHKKWI